MRFSLSLSLSVVLALSFFLIGANAAHANASKDFSFKATNANQAVVVLTDGWNTSTATLAFIEQDATGEWKTAFSTPAVVGQKGLAWGIGLHPETAAREGPAKQRAGTKREGDGRAPAGVFALGATAYGKGQQAPVPTKVAWKAAQGHVCIDDSNSPLYNQIAIAREAKGTYRSAEKMRRSDALYDVVVVVDHNFGAAAPRVPRQAQKGSCIFLHVWRSAKRGTAGCTAMPKKRALSLLGALVPAKAPVLIQLPRAEYERRQQSWGLPPLAALGL